jgi:hypothetical protein
VGTVTRKITVLLLAADFHRFEGYCQLKGHKKSTLIARLIREHLDREAPDVTGHQHSSLDPERKTSGGRRR